jgi:hypothetical protein
MGEVREPKRKRIDSEKGLKSVPKPLWVVAALCVALLILIPMTRKRPDSETLQPSRTPSSPVTVDTTVPNTPVGALSTGQLQLSESSVDHATRRIKGIAKNTSDKVYENVRISFQTVDTTGARGAASAVISRIEPHGTAKFETQPLPTNWRGYSLPEITGTAR